MLLFQRVAPTPPPACGAFAESNHLPTLYEEPVPPPAKGQSVATSMAPMSPAPTSPVPTSGAASPLPDALPSDGGAPHHPRPHVTPFDDTKLQAQALASPSSARSPASGVRSPSSGWRAGSRRASSAGGDRAYSRSGSMERALSALRVVSDPLAPAYLPPPTLCDLWRARWRMIVAMFFIYVITLCIFPGFLAEDVHNASLGSWYPIILFLVRARARARAGATRARAAASRELHHAAADCRRQSARARCACTPAARSKPPSFRAPDPPCRPHPSGPPVRCSTLAT